MPQFGQPATDDPLGIGIQQRGLAARKATQDARVQDWYHGQHPIGAPPPITNVLADPKWAGLFQAMAEQGVTKARTGAAAGMGNAGFFDLQDPNNLKRQALVEQLRVQDVNAQRDPTVLSRQQMWNQGVQR